MYRAPEPYGQELIELTQAYRGLSAWGEAFAVWYNATVDQRCAMYHKPTDRTHKLTRHACGRMTCKSHASNHFCEA